MKRVLQKAAVFALLGVCLSTFAFMGYVDRHFYESRPRQPDPRSGRIYPEVVHHGARVYGTREQKLVCDDGFLFFGIYALSAFGFYVLNRRWKVLRRPVDYREQNAQPSTAA